MALLLWASPGLAEREHRVRRGQSLSRIARRYNVDVHDLAAANELRVTAELREGQVLRIPERGYYYVRRGDSLNRIATENNISAAELARVNNISRNAPLRFGQRLVLPGSEGGESRSEAERRWGRPRHRGVVRFMRPAFEEEVRIRPLTNRGAIRRGPLRRLAHLLRDRRTQQERNPHDRLVRLLTQISDHFGGRQIVILSGYRPSGGGTRESSRHVNGRAVDMRIRGVPNTALRDYARTLDSLGVGYYPNSSFVHVDVRDRKAYWVDRSGRGQDADYVRDRRERETIDPPSE